MYADSPFDTGTLRIRLKAAEDKVRAFESGEKYVQMQDRFQSAFREQNRKIRRLEYELGRAHSQTVSIREMWFEIYDDVYKETDAEMSALRTEIARLEQRVLEAERQRDDALDKLRDKNHELYEVKIQLDEAGQKIAGLTARINKDYRNSSKSSSQSPSHKTIPNGREKSGRKPGGQKGHIHYGRGKMEPTETVLIPAPPKYVDDPKFKETGRTVSKQLVRLHVGVEVVEYATPEFRNQVTGQRVHADFPEGLTDDVTYDGTLISDHEAALIKHGSRNQECMTHVKRYVISSIENEKNLKWNSMMKDWIEEAVGYWNNVQEGVPENPLLVAGLEKRYDEIISRAKTEYEYEPPSEYYKDGYNLYKRMEEEKERYVLFLHDPSVEPDNNLAERCARKFKRKAA